MSDQSTTTAEPTEKPEPITFASFLEEVPPSQERQIVDLCQVARNPGGVSYEFRSPELVLHCTHPDCNGQRFFRLNSKSTSYLNPARKTFTFFHYACANCRSVLKTFALVARASAQNDGAGGCLKLGEFPDYGPPTSSKLISLIGPDRELFLKGRRSEIRGLGIGAYSYYRRVVENQKNRILDAIIEATKKVAADAAVLAELTKAKEEVQFTRAIDSIKAGLPDGLLISGRNPLTLLHAALSDGLHDQSDETCLDMAHDIRTVLAALSERLDRILEEQDEIAASIKRLSERLQSRATKSKT